MILRLLAPLCGVVIAACGGASTANNPDTATAPYPAGLSDQTLTVAGVTRQYRVHVPAAIAANPAVAPKGVVVALHGGGGIGPDVATLGAHPLSVFRTVADREGFVVVYPIGLPAADGSPGWNDCRGDDRITSAADDVGFLATLLDRFRDQYRLPAARLFLTGTSNGAMMTHAFAITYPTRVGAVAASAGNLAEQPRSGPCAAGPLTPVPIMILHGTADTQMPYEGGCVANIGGACNRGRVISAEATRDRWLAANGLTVVTPTVVTIDSSAADAGPARRFDYAGPAPMRWWQLEGAGHTVPSRTVLIAPNALTGIQNRDVEFAEIAWAFFASRLP
ncbi:MAG: hypothetical protein RLZZ25_126 [Gemmatimonadota bacterium]|jgi:polyhydroxybutyrate depolymerase